MPYDMLQLIIIIDGSQHSVVHSHLQGHVKVFKMFGLPKQMMIHTYNHQI